MNQNRMESSDLVDIRTVTVDKSLPKEERIADFVRQIRNPYHFRCGDFVVNASFARNGATLEDCLRGILRWVTNSHFLAGVIQCTWKRTKLRPSQKSLFSSAFPERKGVTFHGKVQSNCLYPSVLYR